MTDPRRQSGFTLLEVLMGGAILFIGATALWYSYQAAARMNVDIWAKRDALALAQRDIELIRFLPESAVNDTAYSESGSTGKRFLVTRTVMDSIKIEALDDPGPLDESGNPLLLGKPREIRVDIRLRPEHLADLSDPDEKPLVTLSTLKPDYIWE